MKNDLGVAAKGPSVSGPPRDLAPSMALLQTVWDSALDPGYRNLAEKGPVRLPVWRQGTILLLAVVLGFGMVVAAKNLRVVEEVQARVETQLADEVVGRQEMIGGLVDEVDRLNQKLLAVQVDGSTAADINGGLLISAGTVGVAGPGVRVTLEGQDGESVVSRRVFSDADLRFVVNLLWESGAEAIAINGNRLGADSTIRTAGSAILVNLEPVSAPFIVEAVGDSAEMKRILTVGPSVAQVNELMADLGISMSVTRAESLSLPRVALPQYKVVTVLTGEEDKM